MLGVSKFLFLFVIIIIFLLQSFLIDKFLNAFELVIAHNVMILVLPRMAFIPIISHITAHLSHL